jgi:hypothetical protein
MKRLTVLAGVVVIALGGLIFPGVFSAGAAVPTVSFSLVPSSPQIHACLPEAHARVTVQLTTDTIGFDTFTINASDLRPNKAYTVFLIRQPGPPFGAAEYIGDFSTNGEGDGHNTFRLIVQEAFSSTLIHETRVRKELNSVGFWFADPRDDNFCLPGSAPTPFDGDNSAGVQVMNSGTHHLPPP